MLHSSHAAVTFTNGSTGVFPYTVPKVHLGGALPESTFAAAEADSSCCMQLAGDVAWYDSVKYTMYTSSNCQASSRVCSLPGKAVSVWLCGCPGGDCSGKSEGDDKSEDT